jgi:hypothetical protein
MTMARFSLSVKIELCGQKNERFGTKACEHYLENCNLCGEQVYCKQHGCSNCNLKKDENSGSLSVIPDVEREMLIEVSQRELEPQKRLPKQARKVNYNEKWLDDALAAIKRGEAIV